MIIPIDALVSIYVYNSVQKNSALTLHCKVHEVLSCMFIFHLNVAIIL